MADVASTPSVLHAWVPNYALAEAARYLRIPASTVRYWAKGGTVTTPERRIHFEQVLVGPPRQRLTFLDLTELLVVRELRETFNVSLASIRKAQRFVQDAFEGPWFLYDLRVFGQDIFIQHIEPGPIAATRSGQMAFEGFLEEFLQRVRVDEHGIPSNIYPRVVDSANPLPVRISPVVAFGNPTISGTGIKTRTVSSRYDAGESLDDIARDYGISRALVADAIRFQVAAA